MKLTNTTASLLAIGLVSAQPLLAQEAIYGVITSENSAITRGERAWLDEVAKNMPGGYDYNLVAGGGLLGRGTEIPGFRDGIVDGGMVSMMYSEAELPVNNMIANFSLMLNDSRVGGAAFAETTLLHCEECLNELVDNNIMPIGPYATSPYSLMCKEPVETMADLKGRSIRATGVLGRVAEAMGGVPVNLGVSEIYEGLQRGQLDCTVFSAGASLSYSYQDVAPNIVNISAGPVTGPTGMSLRYDLWESMDEATRKIFVDAVAEAAALGIYSYYEDDLKVLNNPEEYKITVTEPTDEMKQVIATVATESVAETLENARQRGVQDPEGILEAYTATVEKWRGILEEVGDDQAAYAAALQREIYDKFPLDR